MTEALVELTAREERIVLDLAIRFQSIERDATHVMISSIPLEPNENERDIKNILTKFHRFQWIKWHTNASFLILPSLMNVHRQIVSRPQPNHFVELTNWWFSAKWRAIITAGVILLPLIVQWVEMIQKCLKWFLSGQ